MQVQPSIPSHSHQNQNQANSSMPTNQQQSSHNHNVSVGQQRHHNTSSSSSQTNGQPQIPLTAEESAEMDRQKVLYRDFYKCINNFAYYCLGKLGPYKSVIFLVYVTLPLFREVFKARCKKTGRMVALKKILMENEKEGFPITALREVKMLQQLRHENITELIEVCSSRASAYNRDRSTFYLVFAFCEHDLAGLLSNGKVKLGLVHIKTLMKILYDIIQVCDFI
uniref:Protein kinase domain-containing protein n=1 Tax=Heterorhabditis bacteriophora TaxID=37862 RepID=A0A1I7WRU5_HETBA